ncbi:MAG: lysophospholipid acyltransferase family protein, partial [Myxococcota bacterium]
MTLTLEPGMPRLAPWLNPKSGMWKRATERMSILGAEALWAAVEPRLEPVRYAGHRSRARALQSISRRLCRSHGYRLDVRGAIPDDPVILVSNHLSYIDALALTGLHPVSPIAKVEVGGWPVVGATLQDLGVNFVDRGDPHSGAVALRRAMRALRAGVSVLNFSEGSTSFGDDLLPLKRGIFGLAKLMG